MDCLSGVSRELIPMITSSFERDIIRHAESLPNEEVCGFVLFDERKVAYAKEMCNISFNKHESFAIDPITYLKHKFGENLLGIYHSHPKSDETPSDADLSNAKELGIPYLIYSVQTKKFFLHYPPTYEPCDYIGRPYVKGFYECTSIPRDYYKKEKNLNFSNWLDNYWPPDDDKVLNNTVLNILTSRGKKVNFKDIREGDVILFRIGNRIHCGVYTGDGDFLHQIVGRFSGKDPLDAKYQKYIHAIYRYNENDVLTK